MDGKRVIELLKRSWHESEDLDHDEIYGIIDFIEQHDRLAKLGAAVCKGCTEIFQTTLCNGIYESEECNQVKERCVLKYYCRLRNDKIRETIH